VKNRWLWRAVALLAAGILLTLIISRIATLFEEEGITWAQLLARKPAPLPLIASLALLISVYCMHALLWGRIMRDLGIGRPSAVTALRIYFVSGLARYVPFVKALALAGLAVLAKRAGLPPLSSAAAAVIGQFGFLSTGILLVGATFPEWVAGLNEGQSASTALPLFIGSALLIAAAVGIWVMVATPAGHGLRVALTRRLGARLGEKLAAAFTLADRITPRNALIWAASYAATWLLLALAFLIFVGSFVPEAWQHPRLVGGTVAASYLVGYIVFFLPAGVGAREGAMIVLLSRVMPPAAAVTISVASRLWFTAAELLPLLVLPVAGTQSKLEREETVE
jgi:hypothetical protein